MGYPLRLLLLACTFRAIAELPAAEAGAEKKLEPPSDNAELASIFQEDQSDRRPPAGGAIDWAVVGPRDHARLARIKALYAADELKTGADLYHAAMILQHGEVPEDYLLAHELCVIAVSKGFTRALWLAAASEDRFLRHLGRPQRFGTQYMTPQGGPTILQETDESVTDAHRKAMNAPSLAEAKARTARFDRAGTAAVDLKPMPDAPPLQQTVFAETDDAAAALAKVQKLVPKTEAQALELFLACRDMDRRFAAASMRAGALLIAATHWFRATPEALARLEGWTPERGETEVTFTAEQRANIATRLANVRATRRAQTRAVSYEQAEFEEMIATVRQHPDARAPRQDLITAAMHVEPEIAKSTLRELLPDDAQRAKALAQLERIGQRCELELTSLDGRTIRTRDFAGKVVLLHFFSRMYGATEQNIVSLRQLVEKHGESKVALIGISVDPDRKGLAEMIAERGLTWPVHHNRSVSGETMTDQFAVRITPYFLLLDRNGRLRYRGIQATGPTTASRVEALVREDAP